MQEEIIGKRQGTTSEGQEVVHDKAQVSITSHEWVKENLGDITISPLEELIGSNLELKAVKDR